MGKVNDLTGRRFGRLVVIRDSGERSGRNIKWLCKCDCGNEKNIPGTKLLIGNTKSCGCLGLETQRESGKKTGSKNISAAIKMNAVKYEKEGTNLNGIKKTRKVNKNNTSGYKGVTWNKENSKWQAFINFKRKKIYLGKFSNKKDAINARKEAEEKYFKPILEKYGKGNDGNETVQISKQGKS